MTRHRTIIWLGVFCFLGAFLKSEAAELVKNSSGLNLASSTLSGVDLKSHVEKIDGMIEVGMSEHGVKPNQRTSDPIFLRRIYLDTLGRIPTLNEASDFLRSTIPTKRRDLIHRLLESEGNVSREFNYWADLLRVQSRMRNAPGAPYLNWIKSAIRENKPYDEMVRNLITAEGYIWDDGAAGYYLRDAGMPLDHMANTFQVFLGTQLVCAQCHDHPYDEFTQIDYYEQAAYIYGVKTTDRKISQEYRKISNRKKKDDVSPDTKRVARQMIRPLRYRVNETSSKLRLPDDYQYDDAKPKSVVQPDTIFGDTIELSEGESPRDSYAKWLTSADNPRFATVIANRLWKRVMGVGIIEPVDDLSDGYSASHPGLMEHLAKLMVDLDFNLKDYLRVLYNTQTYQRNVSVDEWEEGSPYFFEGPLLKRMSAEQLWDSVAGLVVPDLDQRKGNPTRGQRYGQAEELVGMGVDEILKLAEEKAKVDKISKELRAEQTKLRNQMKRAQSNNRKQQVRQLKEKQSAIGKKLRQLSGSMRYGRPTGRSRRPESADSRWKGIPSELVRASEIQSPAPAKHFLRQFGQSDRETIENANDDANVPQILTLLNGPIYSMLRQPYASLQKNCEQASNPNELLDAIYLSILSRMPSPDERQLLLPGLTATPEESTYDLTWALLNTRQFSFIQ